MPRYYFDHNATTPVAPEVLDAMTDVLRLGYGNASSIHREGQQARQLLESARRTVAAKLGADPTGIVFTSGGTEANNLGILGLVRSVDVARRHVITTAIEHPSVLEACRQLEREGVSLTVIPVDAAGRVSTAAVRAAILAETVLVTVMHANNEVGTLQQVDEIAAAVREAQDKGQRIWFHSDGVQAFGKMPVDVGALDVDLYSISSHKIYAPKGTGALWVRKGVPLRGIVFGGRHERERRAGTENVAGAVALARATELAGFADGRRMTRLRDLFEATVLAELPEVHVNGDTERRVPNVSNLLLPGIPGESMVIALDLKGFAVSSGAACSSGSIEPSPVLLAMGRSYEDARSCVRFSLGRGNDEAQVLALAEAVITSAKQLRVTQKSRKAAEYAGV
ncbi:MAG: cysteine desulfurase family protein [Bryobacteraceae bacterium]